MKILGIDTSSKIASVAVSDGERLLGEITYEAKQTHSQVILPLAKELLDKVGVKLDELDCIAVSEGPGSYTGLRIGLSAVKGLCFDEKTKCVGISTLRSLAQNVSCFNGIVVSVMKARNRLDYVCAYLVEDGKFSELCKETIKSYDEIFDLITDDYERQRDMVLSETSDDGVFDVVQNVNYKIMLVGDDAENIKKEMFEFDDRVGVAPISCNIPRAGSLCEIAQKDTSCWGSPEKLEARYLQITKAEKDLREGVK